MSRDGYLSRLSCDLLADDLRKSRPADSNIEVTPDEHDGSPPAGAHHAKPVSWLRHALNPFRIATVRGLAVVLPPLLTIIFFFWAWNTIERAVLQPAESAATYIISWSIAETLEDEFVQSQLQSQPPTGRMSRQDSLVVFVSQENQSYCQVNGKSWIPFIVYEYVQKLPVADELESPRDYYREYIQSRFLKRHLVIPAFLAAFLAVLYLIGKLMAAGIGRILWVYFERLIERLPIIRNVYSSVKQVTDFAFSKNEIEFSRVVAVEYPRKGIWSMGFVTSESMQDIRRVAGEPMLTVLMPTSPMPATGFTISVPKSQTINLNITIDQAIQFCVSCGVVVPDHQQPRPVVEAEIRRRLPSTSPPPDPGDLGQSQPDMPSSPGGTVDESSA